MQSAPREWMEAVVGFLIPPACREEVLGDLHERYTGPRRYIADAVRTVPLVIASRIRRTADPQVLLMEAFALYISFLAAAWRFEGLPFLYTQRGFLRLAIPAAVALVALILADAYANPRKRAGLTPILEAALGVALAFLSQSALWFVDRELLVPRGVMISAGGMSVLLVSTLRMLFPSAANRPRGAMPNAPPNDPRSPTAEPVKMSLDEIRRKAIKFEKKTRWKNIQLVAVAIFTALVLIAFLRGTDAAAQPASKRIAGGVIIAAVLYVIYQTYKRGLARSVPADATFATSLDFYRAQLERRRDALLGFWRWYVGPILGAMMAFALRFPLVNLGQPRLWLNIAPFVVLAVIWSVMAAHLSQREARKLQREIDALDALEKQQS
jgi:hypothetical protein